MNQQQYEDKLAQVAKLATAYIRTGEGYDQMKDAFNELCEGGHANKGINHESTIGRRVIMAKSVVIKCINQASVGSLNQIEDKLKEIAEGYQEDRPVRRAFRR